MSKNKHLGLLIDPETHYKLHYMAKYEGPLRQRRSAVSDPSGHPGI